MGAGVSMLGRMGVECVRMRLRSNDVRSVSGMRSMLLPNCAESVETWLRRAACWRAAIWRAFSLARCVASLEPLDRGAGDSAKGKLDAATSARDRAGRIVAKRLWY